MEQPFASVLSKLSGCVKHSCYLKYFSIPLLLIEENKLNKEYQLFVEWRGWILLSETYFLTIHIDNIYSDVECEANIFSGTYDYVMN